MLYLLVSLLVFGLLQSFFELKKDTTKKKKWRIERILSMLYIIGFIIGCVVIIMQDKESTKVNKLISDISFSVTKIDSTSLDQVNKLSKSIEETKLLVKITDSMNKNIVEIIKIRDSLVGQTKKINEKLVEQLKLDNLSLEEKEAKIVLMDYDIKWLGDDSTSYSVQACLRNLGKRNAIMNGGNGYIVFFDKQNKPFLNIDFPGNNNTGVLQPNQPQEATLCFYSYSLHNFQILKSTTSFAVMCLKIKYQDALYKSEKVEYFYSGWTPTSLGFGGLKDWQIGFAKKWESENYKFK